VPYVAGHSTTRILQRLDETTRSRAHVVEGTPNGATPAAATLPGPTEGDAR
jgi:hypothetical protein